MRTNGRQERNPINLNLLSFYVIMTDRVGIALIKICSELLILSSWTWLKGIFPEHYQFRVWEV